MRHSGPVRLTRVRRSADAEQDDGVLERNRIVQGG